MANLHRMSRILYHHDWTNVEDWASNVAELADLSDDEIVQLPSCTAPIAHCDQLTPAERTEQSAPFAARARKKVADLCMTLTFSMRRAY